MVVTISGTLPSGPPAWEFGLASTAVGILGSDNRVHGPNAGFILGWERMNAGQINEGGDINHRVFLSKPAPPGGITFIVTPSEENRITFRASDNAGVVTNTAGSNVITIPEGDTSAWVRITATDNEVRHTSPVSLTITADDRLRSGWSIISRHIVPSSSVAYQFEGRSGFGDRLSQPILDND